MALHPSAFIILTFRLLAHVRIDNARERYSGNRGYGEVDGGEHFPQVFQVRARERTARMGIGLRPGQNGIDGRQHIGAESGQLIRRHADELGRRHPEECCNVHNSSQLLCADWRKRQGKACSVNSQ